MCRSLNAPYLFHTEAADISGKIIYVSEDGNDFSGNGSSGSPYRSIKKAADEATARKPEYVRYMDPSQSTITVDAFNAQLGTKTNSSDDPIPICI